MEYITRMVEYEDEQTLIDVQINDLKNKQNLLVVPWLLGQLI